MSGEIEGIARPEQSLLYSGCQMTAVRVDAASATAHWLETQRRSVSRRSTGTNTGASAYGPDARGIGRNGAIVMLLRDSGDSLSG